MFGVVTIETPELGDRSYLAHDGDVAIVIDPQRDIDRVAYAAGAAGVRIVCVAETHLHNDYVSGGLALARLTGADYLVSAADEVGFDRHGVVGGDQVTVGSMTLRVISAPGHTEHHLAYVLSDAEGRQRALFSGGSMLYGTVGRTDLVGPESTDGLTRAQYRSVRRLASGLPADVEVLPTHGFGSFCSSAKASGATESTIGAERSANLALVGGDEDAFVEQLLAGLMAYPRYYSHTGARNRAGASPIDLSAPNLLHPEQLSSRIDAGEWVVDLRQRRAFAAAHVKGAIGVELASGFATYLGWVIPWGTPVTLMAQSPAILVEAQRCLARIGIDRPAGGAIGEPATLAGDRSLSSYPVSDFAGLALARSQPDTVILDVRRDDEWRLGHLAGAVHIPLADLVERLTEIPSGTLWAHCASGYRAAIAASLLDRAGRDVVLVDDEWASVGTSGLALVDTPQAPAPA
ncbi:MAG: rhodanese-like domain-containing protein [Acidimicrobiales bacterium]